MKSAIEHRVPLSRRAEAVGEAALAHVIGKSTEAAYVRGGLFTQRRELVAAWADFAAPRRGRRRSSRRRHSHR